jgi:transcriptional regulator with XRE-family HTH domain
MSDSALRRDLGQLIRLEREAAGLSIDDLAARAGTTPGTLIRVERATHTPSLELAERVFAALGLRLRLGTERVADLDAELDRLALQPLAQRLDRSGMAHLLSSIEGFPFVIDGAVAAALHGIPVPLDTLDIAVAWADAEVFSRWLTRRFAYRWHERSQEFRMLDLDPRSPGPHYWNTTFGKVRADMCDELPDAVELKVGDEAYRVRPLGQVRLHDEAAAALMRRYQERRAVTALPA